MRFASVFFALGGCAPVLNAADVVVFLEPGAGQHVQVLDVDQDGANDLVIDNLVFFGPLTGVNGEVTLIGAADLELPAPGPVRSLLDWTGDGVPDLVMKDQILHGPFLSDRAWQESARTSFAVVVADGVSSVVEDVWPVGDLTGDDVPDLLVAWDDGGLRAMAGPFAAGEARSDMAIANLDFGRSDALCVVQPGVMLARQDSGAVGLVADRGAAGDVSLRTVAFEVGIPKAIDNPSNPERETFGCAGDLDGDGAGDVFVGVFGSSGGAAWASDPFGPTPFAVELARPIHFGGDWSFATGDLDGDGAVDAVAGNPTATPGSSSEIITTGEVDAGEVRVISDVVGRSRSIWHRTGGDSFARLGAAVAVGDLNDDGQDDLVVTQPSQVDGKAFVVVGPL